MPIFVLAFAALLSVGASDAFAAKGKCSTPKTAYRTETDVVATTSTSFVPVPKTGVSFKQGGNKASCVVVRFSVLPDADYIVYIRPVIDSTILATPTNVQLEYNSPSYLSTRSFEFVFPEIEPGKHVLRMEWVTYGGQQVQFFRRTVTVQHR
jgi:hypothetical protein